MPTTKTATVTVWKGAPEDVETVSYEGEKVKVELAPAKDAVGSYYVGTVTRTIEKRVPQPVPESPADAGTPLAEGGPEALPGAPGVQAPEAVIETRQETVRFVSVDAGKELLGQLAPLLGTRKIGPVAKDREAEFGLDADTGALVVRLGGQTQKLAIGGATPGGADRYARAEGGDVYAIADSILRDLKNADSRLVQRRLHAWEPDAVKTAKLTAGPKSREIVVLAGPKPGFADSRSPELRDETLGNWMEKLGHLQASKHVEHPEPPVAPADVVFRLDYVGESGPLGFIELARTAPDEKGQPEYLVRSELTRWWATAPRTGAAGVADDVGSVVE